MAVVEVNYQLLDVLHKYYDEFDNFWVVDVLDTVATYAQEREDNIVYTLTPKGMLIAKQLRRDELMEKFHNFTLTVEEYAELLELDKEMGEDGCL